MKLVFQFFYNSLLNKSWCFIYNGLSKHIYIPNLDLPSILYLIAYSLVLLGCLTGITKLTCLKPNSWSFPLNFCCLNYFPPQLMVTSSFQLLRTMTWNQPSHLSLTSTSNWSKIVSAVPSNYIQNPTISYHLHCHNTGLSPQLSFEVLK